MSLTHQQEGAQRAQKIFSVSQQNTHIITSNATSRARPTTIVGREFDRTTIVYTDRA
jgi:hypothetical protein